MHSTSLLWLLKEFRGWNLQNFIPSASAYAFGRRPNFFKQELRLWPNVKITASVILWTPSVNTYSVLGSLDIQGNNEIVCNKFSSVKRISILNCPCPSFVRTYKVCTWFFHKSENVHYYRKFSQCRTEDLDWGIFQEVWPSSLRKTITGT